MVTVTLNNSAMNKSTTLINSSGANASHFDNTATMLTLERRARLADFSGIVGMPTRKPRFSRSTKRRVFGMVSKFESHDDGEYKG